MHSKSPTMQLQQHHHSFGVIDDLVKRAGGCAVIDGGFATQLEHHGANLNDPLWSSLCLLTAPELISKVHWEYLEAGAEVLVTASYQATLQGFKLRGISTEDGESYLQKSVQLACEARDSFWNDCQQSLHIGALSPLKFQRALVAASIGSYGAFLANGSEYSGDYGPDVSLENLKDFHRRRMQVLADAGADLLAFETIPSKLEAQACIELLEEEDVKIPSWMCFSSRDGVNVASGDSFTSCVELASRSEKIVAVGVNCTPPQLVNGLILSAKRVTAKHIIVYPNSGEVYDPMSKRWLPSSNPCDDDFVSYVQQWRSSGANLVGGCCRTTPTTIQAIKGVLSKRLDEGSK